MKNNNTKILVFKTYDTSTPVIIQKKYSMNITYDKLISTIVTKQLDIQMHLNFLFHFCHISRRYLEELIQEILLFNFKNNIIKNK